MTKATPQTPYAVAIVDYDPRWPEIFLAERKVLMSRIGSYFVELEHIGSTAILNQRAKPVIDIMAAVNRLDELETLLPELVKLDYQLIDAGMRNRYFLRKQDAAGGQTFHLHIVELSTWAERKERLMRDYLLRHPEDVQAYGRLKDRLAKMYPENSLTYTEAKTDFIQGVVDKARGELGLPSVSVWED